MGSFSNRSFSYSILLHGMFFAFCMVYLSYQGTLPKQSPNTITYIEVDPITAPARPIQDDSQKQVVQTDQGRLTKEAAPDAFLGERTQTVEKTQVATSKLDQAAQAPKRAAQPKSRDEVQEKPTFNGSLANLGIALPKPGMKPEEELQQASEEEGSLANQVKGEYVKGFKTGEKTLLNTREYVFYGYFQRIRERLDRAWEKSLKDQLTKYFYKGRQLASEMDYTTKLLVTLDHDGQIVKVQIMSQSGTRDLDDAAIKAFNDAGPFPNPPKGLVDNQGTIQVRWDFVLRT